MDEINSAKTGVPSPKNVTGLPRELISSAIS